MFLITSGVLMRMPVWQNYDPDVRTDMETFLNLTVPEVGAFTRVSFMKSSQGRSATALSFYAVSCDR